MIKLFDQNEKKIDRQSSKGNQLKWKNGTMWYKADYAGYEGLAEYVVSHLLEKSSLKSDEYVKYELEEIEYKSTIFRGVRSDDFTTDSWQIITLERLFRAYYGESLQRSLVKIDNHENRLEFLIKSVENITGLKEFGVYLNKIFTIDAFFLNEDRHMHNIAVLMNDRGEYDYCPIFDNGASLLSDTTMDYPENEDIMDMLNEPKSKSICDSFEEQLEVSEKLYGNNLTFNFLKKNVEEIINNAAIYDKEIRERVKEIIFQQMRKYSYLI